MAGFDAVLQIPTVEEFAPKQPARGILDQKMVDGIATVSAHGAHRLATHYSRANGVNAVGPNVANVRKVDAVFVPKRKIGEQVSKSVQAALGEQLGALRPDSFHHADLGGQGERKHAELFIPERASGEGAPGEACSLSGVCLQWVRPAGLPGKARWRGKLAGTKDNLDDQADRGWFDSR